MAIKNDTDIAGGIDWTTGQTLYSVDLNDTFDKINSLVNTGN